MLGFSQIWELRANKISILLMSQIEAKLTAYEKYLTIAFKMALRNGLHNNVLDWVRK